MEITSSLLGTRDMLEMEMVSIEYILPSVRSCYMAIQKYPSYPSSFDGIKILEGWHSKLSAMKVADALEAEEIKQLKFDLGNVYDNFSQIVQN